MKKILAHGLASLAVLALISAAASTRAAAQESVDSVLRPPKGAQVAIVVFEDLQCPMCRRTAPLVEQASKTYKIPVIRHDFPLPMHNWSYQAAVMARYFDTHSKQVGNEFRDYIFENQLVLAHFLYAHTKSQIDDSVVGTLVKLKLVTEFHCRCQVIADEQRDVIHVLGFTRGDRRSVADGDEIDGSLDRDIPSANNHDTPPAKFHWIR